MSKKAAYALAFVALGAGIFIGTHWLSFNQSFYI